MNQTAPSLHATRQCLGREHDLATINDLHSACETRGCLVIISGPPGIGKSTFLVEAERLLSGRGGRVISIRCTGGATSLRPIVDLLHGLLDLVPGQKTTRDIRARVEKLLAWTDNRTPAPLDRIELFEALAAVLAEAAAVAGRLVASFHDLHLADPATREAVGYLARALAAIPELQAPNFPGMLIATTPDLQSLGANSNWAVGANQHHIVLGGLDEDGVRAFVTSPEFVRTVHRLTAGSPQRLEALAAGQLPARPVQSGGEADDNAGTNVLRGLSVFGQPSTGEGLQCITGMTSDRLAAVINTLAEAGIVEKTVVSGELRIGFCRAGIERETYNQIPEPNRRDLHQKVAAYLQRRSGADIESVAMHLLQARAGDAAVDAAIQAAEALELLHCSERAADLYLRALSQCRKPLQRRQLRESLCALYERTSRFERATEVAMELAAETPLSSMADRLRVPRLLLLRGDHAGAVDALKPLIAEDRQSVERAAILALWAEAQMLSGDSGCSEKAAAESIALLPSDTPDLETRGIAIRARNTLARLSLDQDCAETAAGYAADNLRDAQRAGLAPEEIRAHIQLGLADMRRGWLDAAQSHYAQARDLAETIGDGRALGACLQHLGVHAERRRHYKDALSFYQEAIIQWKRIGHPNYLSWVSLDLASLYLDLGHVDKAESLIRVSYELSPAKAPMGIRINNQIAQGRVADAQCRLAEAERHYHRAIELAQGVQQRERRSLAISHLAELQLKQGNLDQVAALLAEISGKAEPPHIVSRRLRTSYRLHTLRGDDGAAETALNSALDRSREQGDLEAEWILRHQVALRARRCGREQTFRRELQRAIRSFAQLLKRIPSDLHPFYRELPHCLELANAQHELSSPKDRDRSTGPHEPVELAGARCPSGILGSHEKITQLLNQIRRLKGTDATILIRGESGTGKELVADALHAQSDRAHHPLVKVNCAALVDSLLLSELFGHEKGAFTGATQRKIGRFEVADGGTIFLDEIGDISMGAQVALLRILQQRTFERVGGTAAQTVDVRIICATHRDLESMVAAGSFREDLYYRLRGIQLEAPPLRERRSDIPLLVRHTLDMIAEDHGRGPAKRPTQEAMDLLTRYRWPGNVRELQNVLRSVAIFTDGPTIHSVDLRDFPQLHVLPEGSNSNTAESLGTAYQQLRHSGVSLRDLKKQLETSCIEAALKETHGNITKAAELLGMKRPRLSQLIKEYALGNR